MRRLIAGMLEGLGGGAAVAGMLAAGAAGVLLGFASPALLQAGDQSASAYTLDDLLPDPDLLLAELTAGELAAPAAETGP